MVRAIDTSVIHSAVYPGDDEDPTTWRYKIPTLKQDREISRAAQGSTPNGGLVLDAGNQEIAALKLCMEAPINFKDENGEEVPWDHSGFGSRAGGAPTEAYLGKIPPLVRGWLSNLIQAGATLTVDEAKNS